MTDDSGRETAHVSATMLGGICPRQTWLKGRRPWYLNPERSYQAYRGTIGHLMLEQYPEPGAIYEQRFELVLPDGRIVTGKIDKLHPGRKEITDAKTKAEDKAQPKRPDAGYVWQLNFYRYLAWHGSPQVAITHDGIGNPLDHPILPGRPANIPIERLQLNYWTFGWVKTIPVPLLAEEDVLNSILEGVSTQYDDEPPPIPAHLDPAGLKNGTPATFCRDWCPVREACLELLLDGE